MAESRNQRILKNATSRLDKIRALNSSCDVDNIILETLCPQQDGEIQKPLVKEKTPIIAFKEMSSDDEDIPAPSCSKSKFSKEDIDIQSFLGIDSTPLSKGINHDISYIQNRAVDQNEGLLVSVLKKCQMLLFSIMLWEFLCFFFYLSSFKITSHEWIAVFAILFTVNKEGSVSIFKSIYLSLVCTILGGLIVNSMPVFTLINR